MSTVASSLVSSPLQTFSALVRTVPIDWKKGAFVSASTILRRWKFDFNFHCKPVELIWSAAGFPDMLTRTLLFKGTYQPEVVAALRGLVKPGDTVFDVGGHHGLMALVAAKAAGRDGRVVTFEPNPGARQLIRHHARLNGISNLLIEPLALSETAGSTGCYSMKIENGQFDRIEEETIQLDGYVQQSGQVPQVIKIDAEGVELVILRGATETIERYKPAISMEFNPESSRAAQSSVGELRDWFASLGYRILVLQGSRRLDYSIERSERFDATKHCVNSNFCNVICLPPGS